MRKKEIKKIVYGAIKEVKPDLEKIDDLDSLRFDLGFDSMDELDLVLMLENLLRINFSKEEISLIKDWTVVDLIGFVQRKRERVEQDDL